MSGANPNAQCIFPFQFNGATYHQCTIDGKADGDITPWCSTLVDDSGVHVGEAGNWGNCGSDCPIDLTNITSKFSFSYTANMQVRFLPYSLE